MKTESTQFTTAKGHRVYKRSRVVNGQRVFADTYTLRVKQDGETAYFKLGTVKRDASLKADEIMAFLSVGGNTLNEALVRYSETHKGKAIRATKAPETTSTFPKGSPPTSKNTRLQAKTGNAASSSPVWRSATRSAA